MQAGRTALVVHAWSGSSDPLALVRADTAPEFDLILFDYSGTATGERVGEWPVISVATECKGEIYREVHRYLSDNSAEYEYVGLIDDDIEFAFSDLNRLLAIAREHALDSFQAALTPDSEHAHRWLVARAGSVLRRTPWVEVMMPFYRTALFMAGGPFFAHSISSYGIDQFVFPALQKLGAMDRVAVIDAVLLRHARPITSDRKVFSNELTAHQERIVQWRQALDLVKRERPDLIGTCWYLRTFAPLGGHHRFWTLRLMAPWSWLRGLPHRLRRRRARG